MQCDISRIDVKLLLAHVTEVLRVRAQPLVKRWEALERVANQRLVEIIPGLVLLCHKFSR